MQKVKHGKACPRLKVYCVLCGAFVETVAASECEQVAGTCKACVLRAGGGK